MDEPPEPEPDSAGGPGPSSPITPGSAAITGGISGSALATFAQTLREPYRTYVMLLAPAATAAITSFWPLLLAELSHAFRRSRATRRERDQLQVLDRLKAEIVRDSSRSGLSRERRAELKKLLEEADAAIDEIRRRRISRVNRPGRGKQS